MDWDEEDMHDAAKSLYSNTSEDDDDDDYAADYVFDNDSDDADEDNDSRSFSANRHQVLFAPFLLRFVG